MEDPSGNEFSQITEQLTEQLNGILTDMLSTAQTHRNPNNLINFRMVYTNPFEHTGTEHTGIEHTGTEHTGIEHTQPESIRNLFSLLHHRSHRLPRTPFFSRRIRLAPLIHPTSLNDILRHSMENTGGTKQVASDETLESIASLSETTDISTDEECPICMDGFSTDNGITVECGHIFHRGCITEWFKGDHRCPVCRHEYPSKEISLVEPDDVSMNQEEYEHETNDPGEDTNNDNDTYIDSDEDILDRPSENVTTSTAMRSFENMIRERLSSTFEEELNEERLIQQAIFNSLREPMPYDISDANNESD